MAHTTLIDFKRLKPLTLDGLWTSGYAAGDGPFSDTDQTHFYYWLVDNIPFLRLNERDALFTRLMNLGYISAFPFKNYANPFITDLTPVIVDFQGGYIHQSFSKQDLDINESIGFVIANFGSNSTFYTDDSGIRYYYVILNLNNAIIPFYQQPDSFAYLHIGPTQTHATLIPEQTKLYCDLHGNICTLGYPEEKMSRLDDEGAEIPIEIGNVVKVNTTSNACVCNLTSSSLLGASTGLDNINHSNLEDIEAYEIKRAVGSDMPDLYVYGHYGYQTKIIKYTTALGFELDVYDPVQIDLGNTIKKYAGSNSFLGYVYYKKENSSTIDYYIVTCGEYNFPTATLTASETYFLDPQGVLVSETSTAFGVNCVKIGTALSTTTLLIESNTSSFNINFLTNLGITTFSTSTKGEQVGATADTFGMALNHKYLSGRGIFGNLPIVNDVALSAVITGLVGLKRYSYQEYYTTPTSASWASGWSDTSADKPLWGFIQQPPTFMVQRLSPEYDSTGDIRYDRVLVYLSSTDRNNYNFLNALDVSAVPNTSCNYSPAFQSDLDGTSGQTLTGAAHAISSAPTLTYGTTAEITITVGTDFKFDTPTMASPTAKTFYPTNRGISLKPNNGLVAFFNSATTPICSSTIYCYYETVELTGTKTYKFTNCTLFNTTYLNTPTATAIQPNYVISIPTGAFTFKVGGTSAPIIAGMLNPNPHLMTQYSKFTAPYFYTSGDWYENRSKFVMVCGNWTGSTTGYYHPYRQVVGCMGLQDFSYGKILSKISLFQNSTYTSLEATANFSYPLLVSTATGAGYPQTTQNLVIDTTYNFYKYIDIDTMYINPHTSLTSGGVTHKLASELQDRIPIKLRLGVIGEPNVSTFHDSFVFCNQQTLTMGFDLRPGLAIWRKHKVGGVGAILYIARQNVDVVEDYIDIHLDPSALAYQINGDFGNQVPIGSTPTTIDHPYNFDIICQINGKQYVYGCNDTIRLYLPPDDPTDDIRYDSVKEVSSRQKPYLTLTYTNNVKTRAYWVNDLDFTWVNPTQPPSDPTTINSPQVTGYYTTLLQVGPVIAPHIGD